MVPDEEERISLTPISESLKLTYKSFTIRTHRYSHETHLVLDHHPCMSESDVLVLLVPALKSSKGTQCTQLIKRHTQNELHMLANHTGSVYCQIDKDGPSHDESNIYININQFGLMRLFKFVAYNN